MDDRVRIVEVKVTTKDGKDDGAVPTVTEVDRGAGYVRVNGQDITANKEACKFELRPGERLVIEGYTPTAIAYDREQAAAYRPDSQQSATRVDAPSKEPLTDEKVMEMRNKESKEVRRQKEQTSASGAKPSDSQDSRIKSSPGTTVTEAMKATPGSNTGAPSSVPQGAQTRADQDVASRVGSKK